MILNYGDIIGRPLFTDVLSGEFSLAKDPDRHHTLARLAVAACVKGQEVNNRPITDSEVMMAYTPSWAPNVQAVVSGKPTGGYFFFSSIGLEHEDGDRLLDVTDVTNDEDMAVTILAGQNDLRAYQIELGEKLAVARKAVTAAVADFFGE